MRTQSRAGRRPLREVESRADELHSRGNSRGLRAPRSIEGGREGGRLFAQRAVLLEYTCQQLRRRDFRQTQRFLRGSSIENAQKDWLRLKYKRPDALWIEARLAVDRSFLEEGREGGKRRSVRAMRRVKNIQKERK